MYCKCASLNFKDQIRWCTEVLRCWGTDYWVLSWGKQCDEDKRTGHWSSFQIEWDSKRRSLKSRRRSLKSRRRSPKVHSRWRIEIGDKDRVWDWESCSHFHQILGHRAVRGCHHWPPTLSYSSVRNTVRWQCPWSPPVDWLACHPTTRSSLSCRMSQLWPWGEMAGNMTIAGIFQYGITIISLTMCYPCPSQWPGHIFRHRGHFCA